MIGVLLAGGDGKRIAKDIVYPSKVLIQIDGESLLRRNMRLMEGFIDSYIIVVGKAEQDIRADVGDTFMGKDVRYVTQTVRDGSLGALRCVYQLVKEEDIVLVLADEYITGSRLEQMNEVFNRRYPDAIMGVIPDSDEKSIGRAYSVSYEEDMTLPYKGAKVKELVEKPTVFPNRIRGTGYYFLSEFAVRLIMSVPPRDNGQYEITDLFSFIVEVGGTVITRTVADKEFNINSIDVLKSVEEETGE